MKVNIITKHSSYNFGAMLQAYALQKTVADIGADCNIIDWRQPKPPIMLPWKSVGGIVKNIASIVHKKELLRGYSRFEDFINNNYIKTDIYDCDEELRKKVPMADVYITGSDQVWNPLKISDAFFLRFAPKSAIKASYAASMGISYLPCGTKSLFKEYVSDMDYISVREEDAKKIVEAQTGRSAEVNIDPVLLLDKEQWNKTAIDCNIKKPYILCYILYRPAWLNDWLRKLKKRTKKDIVVVTSEAYRNIYHNKMVRDAGPREFLGLIKGADCIISSSFHGTALAIALHKQFYAVVNPDMPARIDNLLKTFGLQNRAVNSDTIIDFSDIDYDAVEIIRRKEYQKSMLYLKNITEHPKKYNKDENKEAALKGDISTVGNKCTACTACINICPQNAITLIKNDNGFGYPVIDRTKCINCGMCLKKCHVMSHEKNSKEKCEAFFGWHKDAEVRSASSSGGLFSALSRLVLNRGGIIIAAYFDSEAKAVLHGTSEEISFEKFRRSKYVESDIGDSVIKIKKALNEERLVLFCGTPCQCAGVRRVFGNNDKLILCDFFCHGVPSGKVFKEYLEYKESKKKARIADYQFRTKEFGWSQYGIDILYDNKLTEHTVGRCEWFFVAAMLDNMFLRTSCYTCDKAVYHEADITIGDFWGIYKYKPELNDNKGISVMLSNTEQGERILNSIGDIFEMYPLEKQYIEYAFQVKTHDKKIKQVDHTFEQYKAVGCEVFIKKYYKKRLLVNRIIFNIKKNKYKHK